MKVHVGRLYHIHHSFPFGVTSLNLTRRGDIAPAEFIFSACDALVFIQK
jgi:hypothetical protein